MYSLYAPVPSRPRCFLLSSIPLQLKMVQLPNMRRNIAQQSARSIPGGSGVRAFSPSRVPDTLLSKSISMRWSSPIFGLLLSTAVVVDPKITKIAMIIKSTFFVGNCQKMTRSPFEFQITLLLINNDDDKDDDN